MLHDKQFFISHIGKRLYRNPSVPPCGCRTCKEIEEVGIMVNDAEHADYLFHTQNDFAAEGIMLNYRTTK